MTDAEKAIQIAIAGAKAAADKAIALSNKAAKDAADAKAAAEAAANASAASSAGDHTIMGMSTTMLILVALALCAVAYLVLKQK